MIAHAIEPHCFRTFLDGKEIERVFLADEENGFIIVYAENSKGEYVSTMDVGLAGESILLFRRFGKVEIEFTGEKRETDK